MLTDACCGDTLTCVSCRWDGMKMGDQEMVGIVSNRNGRHSKKPKPKKIPQRGLGVAQLEKIRLEEEVKSDAANSPALAVTPHPFAQHSREYFFSNDNIYGLVPYNPHLNQRHGSVGTVSSTPNNAGAANNLLSSTYIQEAKNSTRFPRNPNPPYELTALMSPFGVILHGNQQSSSFSSSTVNDAAENSYSAVLSSQTEPPSNQSPYGTYRSVQPDEAEKTILSKRPYPFCLQDPSKTSLHYKFNPFTVHSNSGSLVVTGNPSFRDGIPPSISLSDLHCTNDNRAENRTSEGDFLKLASPSAFSFLHGSKSEQALSYPHTYQAALLKHDSTSSNVRTLDLDSQAQQQSFYMFFPETNITRDGQLTVITRQETDEECIDLNLKL